MISRIFANPFDKPLQWNAQNPFNRPQQPQQPQQPKDIWEQDAGGANDASIRGLRKQASASMRLASDTSPIQHPMQGFARLAEGFNAGLAEGEADRQERALKELAHKQSWALNGQYPDLFPTVAPLNVAPQQPGGLFRLGEMLTGAFGKRDAAQDDATPRGGIW